MTSWEEKQILQFGSVVAIHTTSVLEHRQSLRNKISCEINNSLSQCKNSSFSCTCGWKPMLRLQFTIIGAWNFAWTGDVLPHNICNRGCERGEPWVFRSHHGFHSLYSWASRENYQLNRRKKKKFEQITGFSPLWHLLRVWVPVPLSSGRRASFWYTSLFTFTF